MSNSNRLGKTGEVSINDALAEVLDGMRTNWNVGGQRYGKVLQSGKQPDVIIEENGVSPIIIETEISPANTLEQDVYNKLGQKTTRGDIISSVLGIKIPKRYANFDKSNLRHELSTNGGDFEYFLCTLTTANNINEKSENRFPNKGFLTGNIYDIMMVAHLCMLSTINTSQGTDIFIQTITKVGSIIGNLKKDARIRITNLLAQPDDEQTRLMSSFILLNAVLFHDRAATANGFETRQEHIEYGLKKSQYGNDVAADGCYIKTSKILETWRKILQKDYYPIFNTAKEIIEKLGHDKSSEIMSILFKAADDIIDLNSSRSSDVYGEVFQETISERKKLAANYTRPVCAALLAAMTFPLPDDDDMWKNEKNITSVRVADFACGTGILLLAAYRTMSLRYEMKSGQPMSKLHNTMMSECLMGADVLPVAAHLTAFALASVYPDVNFYKTRIYPVKQGGESNAIGSLEWIRAETETLDASLVRMTSEGESHEHEIPKHASCDIILMNPPYSANKGPGGRDDDKNPGVLFSAFTATKKQREAMSNHANKLFKHQNCASTKAGLGTFFMDLIHEKLKPGGRFGIVLPMTAATGTKWGQLRELISKKYTNVKVISIKGTTPEESSMSGGTGLIEIMITGKKIDDNNDDVNVVDDNDDNVQTNTTTTNRGLFLSLGYRPRSTLESMLIGNKMHDVITNRLEDIGRGGTTVFSETDHFVLDCPLNGSDVWAAVGVSDFSLLQIGYALQTGRLQLSRLHVADVPVTILKNVAATGHSHLQISGLNQHNKKTVSYNGPFMWPETFTSKSQYPAFWSLEKNTNTMLQKPNKSLTPIPGEVQSRLDHVWDTSSSNVHIRSNMRTTSECITMSYSNLQSVGGNGWPSIICNNKDHSKGLVLWCNSTLGILCRWMISNREHLGRSLIGLSGVMPLCVPDFNKLSRTKIRQLNDIFDKFSNVKFDIIMNLWKDENRIALDNSILNDVFDVDFDLTTLRKQLCKEYTINGGKIPQMD